MKLMELLQIDVDEFKEWYESKEKGTKKAVKTVEPKATESKELKLEAREETVDKSKKYKGVGNPMKLRKMLKDDFEIIAEAKKDAAYYVDLLLKAEAGEITADDMTPSADEKPKENKKESTKKEKLTPESFDPKVTYTREQLETVAARPLYEIGRKVFDIPRSEMQTKDETIEALLKAQSGGKVTAEKETKEESTGGKYDGKGAKELYQLCKDRGLNVPMKKLAKEYIEVLEAQDEEEAAKRAAKKELIELYKQAKEIDPETPKGKKKEFYLGIIEEAKEEEPEEDDEWGEESTDDEEEWNLL